MLTIRKEQMDALAAASMARFERRMAHHLRKCFPEWARALGPGKLSAFVRHGIDRARHYGFATELELARYLHVMQAVGTDFDESPAYPWAADLLAAKLPPLEKLDRLQDAADYEIEARRIRNAHH